MWTNVWIALALGVVGLVGKVLGSGLHLDELGARLRVALAAGAAFVLHHPYGVLSSVCILPSVLGWGLTFTLVSPEAIDAAMSGLDAAELCHAKAERLFVDLMTHAAPESAGPDARTASIAWRFPDKDGFGGRLYLDDEGFLTCSLHGRSPRLVEPLVDWPSKEGKDSEELKARCHAEMRRLSLQLSSPDLDAEARPDWTPRDEYVEKSLPQSDHFGGTVFIDDDGRLRCTLHGIAENTFPLSRYAKRKP
ncbi:MAG TPA: hypothetical protein VHE30_11600 [Polyangiaceae bacterium]|nr:hypothetical protein [Polyangiaceae bacterium]